MFDLIQTVGNEGRSRKKIGSKNKNINRIKKLEISIKERKGSSLKSRKKKTFV